jgi:hypothetical protein
VLASSKPAASGCSTAHAAGTVAAARILAGVTDAVTQAR